MKKSIIIGLCILALISFAIAGDVGNIDRTITLSKEQKGALTDMNLGSYDTTIHTIGTGEIEFCMEKAGVINSCKRITTYYYTDCLVGDCTKVYYTPQEIDNIIDDYEEEKIKQIADAKIEREAIGEKTKTDEGTTTIK